MVAAATFSYRPDADTLKRPPLTFEFGLYGEEEFTVTPTPSLGDCFDLKDVPEITDITSELEQVRILAKFIRKMIVPEDRARFDSALYRIPSTHGHLVIDCARWIADKVAEFPTAPADSSSDGQETQATGVPSS